ncbi:hypothetical protein AQUCO_04500062v1 [Aquilegia coerulea]|uniref:Uncharacterized protein n=1 Tax=Aquilegia coerulea TaxID=218851 RepID=A0A2G5CLM2_AQUCA|nr:hypothetical protein AQUCO_04500062v1 [Aquilegia coerulea]
MNTMMRFRPSAGLIVWILYVTHYLLMTMNFLYVIHLAIGVKRIQKKNINGDLPVVESLNHLWKFLGVWIGQFLLDLLLLAKFKRSLIPKKNVIRITRYQIEVFAIAYIVVCVIFLVLDIMYHCWF